jgi:hypothetical protein
MAQKKPMTASPAGMNAARNSLAMFCSVSSAYTTSGTDGGTRMPSVPPAASEPVESAPEYLYLRISGSATCPMVAAVASEDPQIVPNAAQAPTAAIAMPPLKWPTTALMPRNSRADSPEPDATLPISRNSGITENE